MPSSQPFPLKIALFVGNSRPSGSVRKLLYCLKSQKVTIVQIYAYDFNVLWKARYFAGIEMLPHFLKGSQKNIAAGLESKYVKAYAVWLQQFQAQGFDLGISFFGYWLPPSLFNSPRLGFINFHPGKLPDLPGFEPETLAILQQWPRLCGTLHIVAARFDEGPILAYTPDVSLYRHELPGKLLRKVTLAACGYLPGFLWQVAEKGLVPLPINFHYQELPNCKIFTKISLLEDDKEMICRKNRAFNRQKINRILTLDRPGEGRYRVLDVKIFNRWQAFLWFGRRAWLAKPGDKLSDKSGYCRIGMPADFVCFRLRDGFVALRLQPLSKKVLNK